jgi:hypothetical protein
MSAPDRTSALADSTESVRRRKPARHRSTAREQISIKLPHCPRLLNYFLSLISRRATQVSLVILASGGPYAIEMPTVCLRPERSLKHALANC